MRSLAIERVLLPFLTIDVLRQGDSLSVTPSTPCVNLCVCVAVSACARVRVRVSVHLSVSASAQGICRYTV